MFKNAVLFEKTKFWFHDLNNVKIGKYMYVGREKFLIPVSVEFENCHVEVNFF